MTSIYHYWTCSINRLLKPENSGEKISYWFYMHKCLAMYTVFLSKFSKDSTICVNILTKDIKHNQSKTTKGIKTT